MYIEHTFKHKESGKVFTGRVKDWIAPDPSGDKLGEQGMVELDLGPEYSGVELYLGLSKWESIDDLSSEK